MDKGSFQNFPSNVIKDVKIDILSTISTLFEPHSRIEPLPIESFNTTPVKNPDLGQKFVKTGQTVVKF